MEYNAYMHKVQYYETDQMGVVHHSNYIRWFEEARVDYLDQIGISYDKMEEEGCISPVVSVHCDFKSMTKFGETVYIIAKLEKFNGIKFTMIYQVIDSITKETRAVGESEHCFISKEGKLISLKKENKHFYQLLENVIGNSAVVNSL